MTGLKKSWASRTTNVSAHQIVLSHINRQAPLSLAAQAELLGISRGSIYYVPVAPNPQEFIIMNRIDEIYTEQPYYGYRPMTKQLQRDGFVINHKRTARLMKDMGLEAIYPKPSLSKNNLPHPVYPYLLKHLNIVRPNQVWGTDITYIKMSQGFVYLVAFLDWYSRYVVSWQLSTTLTTNFVIEAAQRAMKTAHPEIVNSDQGVQFTSQDYLNIWDADKTRISMDHRGRCFDNIFTERLWRSVKYNDIYPNCYDSVLAVKEGLTRYFDIYNYKRLHESHNYMTPAEIYFN
jgi:putative transposase